MFIVLFWCRTVDTSISVGFIFKEILKSPLFKTSRVILNHFIYFSGSPAFCLVASCIDPSICFCDCICFLFVFTHHSPPHILIDSFHFQRRRNHLQKPWVNHQWLRSLKTSVKQKSVRRLVCTPVTQKAPMRPERGLTKFLSRLSWRYAFGLT